MIPPLLLAGCLAARPISPGPIPPSEPTPVPTPRLVTPDELAAALRAVDPDLVLAPFHDGDGLGVYPPSSFVNAGGFRTPRIWHVLVFRSEAERIATQPSFGRSSIQGHGRDLSWDGVTHSEWVGARNVIVEVEMPGGTFGTVEPWTEPTEFLSSVRAAVKGL